MTTKEKVANRFREYKFAEHLYRELNAYLDRAEEYIKDDNIDNETELKNAYELVYTSLKHQWVRGIIGEKTFWDLVNELKNAIKGDAT